MENRKSAKKNKLVKFEPIFEYRPEEYETTALDSVFNELFMIAEKQIIDTINN